MPAPAVDFIIEDKLKEKIAEFKADTSLLDDYFQSLPTTRVAEFKTWFAREDIRLTIGFPRDGANPPSIAITLADMRVEDDFISEVIEADLEVTEDFASLENLDGALYRGQYTLWILAENNDGTALLSSLVLDWLEEIFPALEIGLYKFDFTMTDLTPEMANLPDFLYARTITVSCSFFVERGIPGRKVQAVDVIQLAPDNTLSEVVVQSVATQ